ncbi:DNA helicase [Tanacetum coccineum]
MSMPVQMAPAHDGKRLKVDDQRLDLAGDLNEAQDHISTLAELRFLFAHILMHCDIIDPSKLWNKYWKDMRYTLYEIEVILNNYGKSVQNFGLPSPPTRLLVELANRLLMEERNYNREALLQEKNDSLLKLNAKHKLICDLILHANATNQQELIFVYGHGEPVKLSCGKPSSAPYAPKEKLYWWSHPQLLADIDLIIWDEAPMNDRQCFEALDRSLRDILTAPCSLFGGKSNVLGGDFRQTLPVKKGASKMEVMASYISESELWSLVNSFASWLLDIGDWKASQSDEEDLENTSWIDIPPSYCMPPDEQAYIINSKVLEMVQGENTTYVSHDEATPLGNDGAKMEMLYPVEHLNILKLPGFPPHQLKLKVGAPVMLIRNVNLTGELCNVLRMIVRQLMTKLTEVQIITGTKVGEKFFIHRISLIYKDPNLPFVFKKRQFPIKLCCAMTINKSQGESLNKIGMYLPEPIFGHGQLYVALSRATNPHGLKILIKSHENHPPNATKKLHRMNLINQWYQQLWRPKPNQSIRRKIDVENLNGNIIEFTLWDEMAKHFEQADLEKMEQLVIIAVSSCLNSKYIDYQLAASPTTYYYLNPNISEAEESRILRIPGNPPIIIYKFPYEDIEQEKLRNMFLLKTLMEQNPQSYKGTSQTPQERPLSLSSLQQLTRSWDTHAESWWKSTSWPTQRRYHPKSWQYKEKAMFFSFILIL